MISRLLSLVLAAICSSGCALHCHNTRTHLLTWYDYVKEAEWQTVDDRQIYIAATKSEADPTLTIGDYVLTDGQVYRVVNQSWDNLPRCSHFYWHTRDPR